MNSELTSPAPLDPAALQQVLAPFGASRNLPREAYISPDVFAWELRRFYEAAWVCLGRADDLARPGDYRAVRVGNDGILLVRGDDGALRGFFNVCRHRGHELLEPGACAHARALRCPYHGWIYELDGRLKVAPRAGELPGGDPYDYGLVPARVEEWRGWVFVNAAGEAPPLADWLGDLERLAADHEPERLRVGTSCTYEVAANWKLVHENFHECYHCPQLHPQLCRVSPPESGGRTSEGRGAWVGGPMELTEGATTLSLDGRSAGVRLRRLDAAKQRQLYYYGVLPNFFLSLHPDYVLTHRLEPLAPNRTLIECHWLFPPEALEKPGFSPAYAFEFWDITNRQDWKALESIQRGVSSRGFLPGPLAERENVVYEFVRRIARAYLEGGLECTLRAPTTRATLHCNNHP